MDATKGFGDVGQLGTRDKIERFELKDRLKNLLGLARKDAEGSGNWAGDEFDGIRSEKDFRLAMSLEEARLRGTVSQRALRALNTVGASLRNSQVLRLLR